jgi:2-dehydropantoate 2-reductase
MRIALIGPGAIGGTAAAALLQTAAHDLTICARQTFDTLRWTRADNNETKAFPANVIAAPAEASHADWVLLAVKSHQTASAADWLAATVGANTRLAILQNGVEHRERVAPFVPKDTPLVPVVVRLPAQRTAPGAITTYGNAALIVPDDAPGREFAQLFAGSFVKVETDGDFQTRLWEKLCLNCAGGALTALTLRPDAIASSPQLAALARQMIDEAMAVGRAEGARFADGFADQLIAFQSQPRAARGNSMYYDRRDGRPLEWDARNGVVGRLGRRHGIATPVSDAMTALLQSFDRT